MLAGEYAQPSVALELSPGAAAVDGHPALSAGRGEKPSRLVEAQGIDPDPGGRRELFDPIFHVKTLIVITHIVNPQLGAARPV